VEVRPEEASRRYDHMQFLVKDDCFEASARTKSTSTLYGPASFRATVLVMANVGVY
jgi:hypothetical protein